MLFNYIPDMLYVAQDWFNEGVHARTHDQCKKKLLHVDGGI